MANTMDKLRELLARAVPFLCDEGAKYADDGNNEPLELAREIDAILRESEAQGDVGAVDTVTAVLIRTLPRDLRDSLPFIAQMIVNALAASAERAEPAEGREACPRDCGCVVHCRREQLQAITTPPAGDGARVTEADRELRERAGQMILRLGQFALIQRRRRYPKNAELAAECAELLAALAARVTDGYVRVRRDALLGLMHSALDAADIIDDALAARGGGAP